MASLHEALTHAADRLSQIQEQSAGMSLLGPNDEEKAELAGKLA